VNDKRIDKSIIELLLNLALPYLDAEAANREIIRLNVELLKLKAQIDAQEINPCGPA
jgi:hypothetical protein